MSDLSVASRYAKSLLDFAKEQNKVDAINHDVQLLYKTVKANPELRAVLANPVVPSASKKAILNALFADKVDKVTLAFFDLMVNKRREAYLYLAAQQYGELYNELNGIVNAKIVSATALDAASKLTLVEMLEEELKRKVVLITSVDSKLVGGFVLTVGDRQYDASLSKQLRNLSREFLKNASIALN